MKKTKSTHRPSYLDVFCLSRQELDQFLKLELHSTRYEEQHDLWCPCSSWSPWWKMKSVGNNVKKAAAGASQTVSGLEDRWMEGAPTLGFKVCGRRVCVTQGWWRWKRETEGRVNYWWSEETRMWRKDRIYVIQIISFPLSVFPTHVLRFYSTPVAVPLSILVHTTARSTLKLIYRDPTISTAIYSFHLNKVIHLIPKDCNHSRDQKHAHDSNCHRPELSNSSEVRVHE